jgi:putative phosphoribosyl transferase
MMTGAPLFIDRTQAGKKLAQVIQRYLKQQFTEFGINPIPIVYALPRGGLPVADPIADLLGCPLTVVVAKKISHPKNSELAIGAVTASGQVLWTNQTLFRFRPNLRQRQEAMEIAIAKAKSLEAQFLPFCPTVNAEGATLILVDDGIATGMTIAVAARALNTLAPAQIVICSPVAPPSLIPWLENCCDVSEDNSDVPRKLLQEEEREASEISDNSHSSHPHQPNSIVVLATPESFFSVSSFYAQFPQVKTSEALTYLQNRSQ